MEANPLEWLMQCGQEGLVSCPGEYISSEASMIDALSLCERLWGCNLAGRKGAFVCHT